MATIEEGGSSTISPPRRSILLTRTEKTLSLRSALLREHILGNGAHWCGPQRVGGIQRVRQELLQHGDARRFATSLPDLVADQHDPLPAFLCCFQNRLKLFEVQPVHRDAGHLREIAKCGVVRGFACPLAARHEHFGNQRDVALRVLRAADRRCPHG